METHDNFRINLYRKYPQLAGAVEDLVDAYNTVLSDLESLPDGELEIEAFFGKLHYSKGRSPQFDNNIPDAVVKRLSLMLDGYTEWDEVQDWFLVYDYYLSTKERVRVIFSDEKRTVTTIKKHSLSRKDFSYSENAEESAWELRDFLTRVCMKLEEPRESVPIAEFDSVKISVRKSYLIRSSNLDKIKFRFDLIQFWTGQTLKEAESSMSTDRPRLTLECEIVNVPRENILAERDKFIMFTGLLIKIQDFLDFPVYYDHVSPTGLQVNRKMNTKILKTGTFNNVAN